MRIGIVGSGNIGATAARLLAAGGHEVVIANSRGPESLQDLVSGLDGSVSAASVEDAAAAGEVVLVAIPLKANGSLPPAPFAGKVVVDANNYYPGRDGQVAELDSGELTSSELLARHLEGARVVKAFNTMPAGTLGSQGRPGAAAEERLALPVAGDDAEAKAVVCGLIEELGFAPVDSGPLGPGGARQEPGTPVYGVEVGPDEARELLAQ